MVPVAPIVVPHRPDVPLRSAQDTDCRLFDRAQTLFTRDDLRLWRDKREWTLRELGQRVEVSASLLCKIERGERPIELWLAMRLLRVLFRGDE